MLIHPHHFWNQEAVPLCENRVPMAPENQTVAHVSSSPLKLPYILGYQAFWDKPNDSVLLMLKSPWMTGSTSIFASNSLILQPLLLILCSHFVAKIHANANISVVDQHMCHGQTMVCLTSKNMNMSIPMYWWPSHDTHEVYGRIIYSSRTL